MKQAAADLSDRTNTFTEELISSLWYVCGWTVLNWMKTSGLRGPDALNDAHRYLPAALILETTIDRQSSRYQLTFNLFGRDNGRPVWSATAPLPDPGNIAASASALAGAYLVPVMEHDFNISAYRRETGHTRVLSTLPDPGARGDPCTSPLPWLGGLGKPPAQVTVGAQALGATSPDTRIEIFAGGQRAYPSTIVHTKEGMPISPRVPTVVDLAADTCVLTGSAGDAPVYGDRCIVPPAGLSDVRLTYVCAPRAQLIDIGRLANDANLWYEETFPSGARVLAGVAFLIPMASSVSATQARICAQHAPSR